MDSKQISHMALLFGFLILTLCQYQCICCNSTQGDNQTCASCGNGIKQNGEECDDGNKNSGDGCSANCTVQANFYCKTVNNTRSVCCNKLIYFMDNNTQCQILCNDGQFLQYQVNVCNNSCPANQFYNTTSGNCTKQTIYDYNINSWVIECDSGLSWNAITLMCMSKCPIDYVLNAPGVCIRKICYNMTFQKTPTNMCLTCTIGMTNGSVEICEYTCENETNYNGTINICGSSCPQILVVNLTTKYCTLGCGEGYYITYYFTCAKICDIGFNYDKQSNACYRLCQNWQIYDNKASICLPCPNGTLANAKNKCNPCPNGSFINQTTWQCQICKNNSYLNTNTNLCQKCTNQTIFNATSLRCQACPKYTIFNATHNSCQRICSENYSLNIIYMLCVSSCPKGQISIDGICTCLSGTFYNETSNKCQPLTLKSYSISSFAKIPTQNAFIVSIEQNTISTSSRLLLDAQMSINTNFPYESYTISSTNNLVSITFTYNESLNSLTSMTVSINNATIQLPPVTDNNLALKYYSSNQYEVYKTFNSIMPIFTYCVIFLLAITFLFSSKLIAIQTLLIFQFTYGGLIMMRKIEAIMYPYKQLWLFNGFNQYTDDGTVVPPRISALNLHANFLSNFNFNLIIYLLPSILGYTFIIAHKILRKMRRVNPLNRYSQYCLGDWQLSGLLVCIQHLIFAFVINIQYSPEPIAGIIIGILLLLLYGFTAFRFYDKRKSTTEFMKSSFGDYKRFFDVQSLNFYIWAMIYRATLSLILVLMSDSIISQSLVFFWTASYATYLILKRPYKKSACLIPIINSLIMVLLAIFFLYQRNKADDADINFATYMPIVVIVLLGLTCIFNSIYAGVNFHHVRKHKNKIKAIKHEVERNKSEDVKLQICSQTLEQFTSQAISQNLSNLIAEIRQQNEKNNHERPTTALKDISPIRPFDQNEIIISSGDISEIQPRNKTISQRVSQQNKSQIDSNVS